MVPYEPEEIKKNAQVDEGKSPGESPKESSPENNHKAPDESLRFGGQGAE